MSSLHAQLETKDNLIKLIQLICIEYKLDPNQQTNIINIKAFLQQLSVNTIISKATSLDDANKLIVRKYGEMISVNSFTLIDDLNKTKNYMVKLIKTPGDDAKYAEPKSKSTNKDTIQSARKVSDSGLASILSLSLADRIEVVKYLNYSSLFREEYIIIDSRYQNTVNTDRTKLEFSLLTATKTKSDHGGIIVGSPIRDIVEIEIYPFTIPYKPIYATFYNKITLSINEWLSSAFEAYEGGQFHFCFDIDKIDENLIYLKPVNSTYSFSSPMNYIDRFTLSFGALFPKIAFDPDRMYPSRIDYTNEYGLFEFSEAHNLVTGDLIYITGFSTPTPARDIDIINEVNRPKGHVIVKKDNNSFIINVDLTPLRVELEEGTTIYPIESFQQSVIIYFASKRIQVQLRLRYLTSYAST